MAAGSLVEDRPVDCRQPHLLQPHCLSNNQWRRAVCADQQHLHRSLSDCSLVKVVVVLNQVTIGIYFIEISIASCRRDG